MMQKSSPVLSLLLAILAYFAMAQDVGFGLDGVIEGATADNANYNTGGRIMVNGWSVIVPKNLQVAFPAAFVPWKDFVASVGAFKDFEVLVNGNVVPGLGAVAGQVSISMLFTQDSQGFITAVNNDGTMKIANGGTIRINDPGAVYSAGYTASPFMTADDENPSISSFSGFPMCVPRSANDPLCPSSNRPSVAGGSKQGSFTAPDPLVMAPFVPGDFVEYSGYTNGAGEIVCYSIVATNVQISTGGVPTYIRMEDANLGVFTSNPNAEQADTRFIGFVSDTAGGPLSISAIDVDPCTGKQTLRQITTAALQPGAARLKFDARLKTQAGDRYTREYLIKAATAPKLTKNNITAGQYVQPVTEWIQPELSTPGLAPLPNDFSAFTHLTNGLGPDASGNLWGPLDPFPQSGVKTFDLASCPPPSPPTPPSPTFPSTSSAPASSTTGPPPPDTVKVTSATWTSSGGGTLTVACSSSNVDSNAVQMVLDYRVAKDGTTVSNIAMSASGSPGGWTFTNVKIKQPNLVTCRSKLGGSASFVVPPK